MVENRVPDRLYVDAKDWEIVESLESENYFNFKNKDRREQFMFALALGAYSGLSEPKIKSKKEFVRIDYLKSEDEAIIKAYAIHKKGSVDILTDPAELYKVAEEAAHIGFKLLKDMIDDSPWGSLEKRFEVELSEVCCEAKKRYTA